MNSTRPHTVHIVSGLSCRKRDESMALLADILTLIRVPLGLAVVYAGATGGEAALPHVVWISLFAWTADSVDGHLRRASAKPTGWVGRHDLTIDVFFNGCVAAFLALAGYVSAWLFSLWVGALGLLSLKIRSRSGTIIAEGFAILMLIIQAFQRAFALGGAVIGWGILALTLDRKRFAHRLDTFCRGLRN